MIDNIRHKSIRKKTASRIAAIQILYLHQFNDQPLFESISIYELHYKKFLLEKLDIKELDTNLLSDLLENFDKNFYIHKNADVLSQFPKPKAELINHFIKTKLPSKNIIQIIKKYGNPYYIKIDVENYDYEILSEIFNNNIFPKYFSVECYNKKIYDEIINNKNYNSYKLVCGSDVDKKYYNKVLSSENEIIRHSFPAHSAGPFGNDIDGKWLAKENFNILYSLRNTTWIDIHCSKDDIPSKYYLPIDLIFFFKKKFLQKIIFLFFIIIFIIVLYIK